MESEMRPLPEQKRWQSLKVFKTLALWTLFFHALPLAFYGWARLCGEIPNSDVLAYARNLTNHGSWYGEVQGFLLFLLILAQLLLIPATLLYALIRASIRKSPLILIGGLLLVCAQVLAFIFVTNIYT